MIPIVLGCTRHFGFGLSCGLINIVFEFLKKTICEWDTAQSMICGVCKL